MRVILLPMKAATTSKSQPLTPKELEKYEAGRDLGAEVLQSIREMRSGKPMVGARSQMNERAGASTAELPED